MTDILDDVLASFLSDLRKEEAINQILKEKGKCKSTELMKEVRKIKSANRFSRDKNYKYYCTLIWHLYNEREVKIHYLARAFGVSRGTIYDILMFYTDGHPLTNAGKRSRNRYRNAFEKKQAFDFEVSKIRSIIGHLNQWITYKEWLGQNYLLKDEYSKAMRGEEPNYSQHYTDKLPPLKIPEVKTNTKETKDYIDIEDKKDLLAPILDLNQAHKPP